MTSALLILASLSLCFGWGWLWGRSSGRAERARLREQREGWRLAAAGWALDCREAQGEARRLRRQVRAYDRVGPAIAETPAAAMSAERQARLFGKDGGPWN